jgi:hypothetical protein
MAIDVDPRNGGDETFADLQAAHGALTSGVMAFTGGGGEHHVFALPPGGGIALPGVLGPGVDVKLNGYIVVEPSIHPSGKPYQWEASSSPLDGVAPSPLPDWLRSFRVELKQPEPQGKPVDAKQARDIREAMYLLDADEYDTWVRCGMALQATGWGHAAYAMWCAWAQQSDKFDGAISAEKWQTFKAEKAGGLTVAWIFAQAQQRGWVNPAARLTAYEAPAGDPPPTPHPDENSATEAPSIPVLSVPELRQAAANVDWLVKHFIPMESIGLFFGASETFKSFIALDLALHVAHGMKWLGKRTRKGPVAYIAAEGGTGLFRRLDAWQRHHGMTVDPEQFYAIPVPVDLMENAGAVREAVTAKLEGAAPVLVVVDTVSQTFSGEENSATEMAAYLREIGLQLRLAWQCAVVAIHHTGHSATERPRGSSAIKANVDFMFGVFRDETEMLATLECVRQKDGDRPKAESFAMSVVELGNDTDGEPITSLAPSRVGGTAEVVRLMEHEAGRGRGGKNHLLLELAFNGMDEKKLRTVFYEAIDGDAEAKRKAYYRARQWAVNSGIFEIAQGVVIRKS